ncbi:hypothetical protein [Tunturiibacter gelidoferens]|uniref:Uncharacterized protein n=2 Tax=Tunturiibacter TaxID=3154218 RepID=A0A7Y9TC76_9BACT|nr:hypothetical protein [Edaphobacter lichenicola]MBB5341173.1 hypothetical protein [Edaphobacter lichenicola]NYF53820.1 hypothetical protein [Edaphobacter lichenicola]
MGKKVGAVGNRSGVEETGRPMRAPAMVPGGLKDWAKLSLRSEVSGSPSWVTNEAAPVSRKARPAAMTKRAKRKKL